MGDSPKQRGPSYLTLLRNRSFASLWVGQLVSQSGDAVFDIALLWLVLQTTGSTALVALTQAAVLIPGVFAGPIAGVYADRYNRRDLMVFSNIAMGAVTAIAAFLYVLGALSFPILIILVLLLYTGAQFYLAANSAIIPRMVSKENIGAANGLFSLTLNVNQLAGYSIGGVIVLAVGPSIPITYDSLTFLFSAAMILLVAKAYGQTRQLAPGEVQPRGTFRKDFGEGLSYVRKSRFFLQLIVFGLIVNGFGGAVFALIAPYAKLQVHGDVSTYGFLLSAFLLGTILGSVVIGKVNFRGYVGKLLFFGVIIFGVLLAVSGLESTIPEALATFAVMGATIAMVNIPISALVQTQIPGELLGRASTVLRALLSASQPAASVIAGAAAGVTSIAAVFVASGLAVAVGSSLLYLVFVELRTSKY